MEEKLEVNAEDVALESATFNEPQTPPPVPPPHTSLAINDRIAAG